VEVLEIVLAGTGNLDCLRRHSADRGRTYQSSTTAAFLQRDCVGDRTRTYSLSVGESRGSGPRWNKRANARAERLAAICVAPGESGKALRVRTPRRVFFNSWSSDKTCTVEAANSSPDTSFGLLAVRRLDHRRFEFTERDDVIDFCELLRRNLT
jgi:hypothetical protein